MSNWHLGIIGGSGLYQPGTLDDMQEIEVNSAFGEPSGPVTMGFVNGVRCSFIARHGEGHRLSPSDVNYRANIDVLKRCGVTDIVAISAIGSLKEEMAPGDFVAVDQFIDRTVARQQSFFTGGIAAHVSLADPVCPRLSALVADAAKAAGAKVHRGGCYVAIEGPQFSTRAESNMYRTWGGDVIGMTAMPEARLAREAELPYALLGMVTDYDCWREGEDGVEVSHILDRALDGAILTAVDKMDRNAMAKLDAVAGRFFRTPDA
jgi:5'-methylthioadenosine phosphorylase